MPYITFTTTKTLTLNQEKALKESAGQLISILPNKKEENLMIHIEDNQVMYENILSAFSYNRLSI